MGFLEKLRGALTGEKVDYTALISDGAVVVDVRTKEEFRGGHVKGSKNFPLQSLGGKVKELKGKTVVLVCRSGARAGQAQRMLNNSGITAHNAGAWQNI
ncbi:MAG: rhodanese-like domain-containing protein [Crocinitomix sp.]|nr:rhodanese-like domain-containing protein [Crocinitomix sp.]